MKTLPAAAALRTLVGRSASLVLLVLLSALLVIRSEAATPVTGPGEARAPLSAPLDPAGQPAEETETHVSASGRARLSAGAPARDGRDVTPGNAGPCPRGHTAPYRRAVGPAGDRAAVVRGVVLRC
ncbi:hypothetical protein [Streptomyces sp. CAU 1734]|uniref:hypothetical protein n=1 Tax=Streptomyces sp. CAU 1734 TaxID=3140360 RepID=UPI00326172AE